MSYSKALQAQLNLHEKKVEKIKTVNPDLAERINAFTQVLIENNFTGVFSVDDDVYHAGLGLSQSSMRNIEKSPFHFYYNEYLQPNEIKARPKHFKEGDFIHRLLLEKETVANLFVSEEPIFRLVLEAKPDTKNVRATKIYKDQVAYYEAQGKEVISSELFEQAHLLESYISEQPLLANIMSNGIAEKACYCICPHSGLIRRGKPDFLLPNDNGNFHNVDLKTTSQDSERFEWSVYNYHYHTQGAYYKETIALATGKKVDEHILMVIDKKPPFDIEMRFIDMPSLEIGQRNYMKWLLQLKECFEAGLFPRKTVEISSVGIPEFKMQNELIEL